MLHVASRIKSKPTSTTMMTVVEMVTITMIMMNSGSDCYGSCCHTCGESLVMWAVVVPSSQCPTHRNGPPYAV